MALSCPFNIKKGRERWQSACVYLRMGFGRFPGLCGWREDTLRCGRLFSPGGSHRCLS